MQPPTYRQFREFSLQRGLTPETLAPFVQSDSPEKAAERLLIHLADTRWDDEPLPYPKLCRLYHGEEEAKSAKPTPQEPQLFNQIPPVELPPEAPHTPPLHWAWLSMFDAGWSIEKIAHTWNKPAETVEAILDKLSQQPLPPEPSLLALPKTEAEGKKYRQLLRELAHRGWSQDSLSRIAGGIFSPELLATITGKGASRKSRSKLDSKRTCPCCKKRVKGRQQYCSDACKMKAARGRKRSALVSVS